MFCGWLTRNSSMRIALGQIGHSAHLVGRGIAGNAAFGLERDIDDRVAVNPVRREIVAGPAGEIRVA